MRYAYTKIYIILILSAIFVAPFAQSATLSVVSEAEDVTVGDAIKVQVMLDTEGESINAIEGTIHFSDSLSLQSLTDGSSIVSLWVEKPIEGSNNTISFSGLIPGGFDGLLSSDWEGRKAGTVLDILFKVIKPGDVSVSVDDADILKHDGDGTSVLTTINNLSMQAFEGTVVSTNERLWSNDTTPPESFEPILTKDENIFDGDYFLVFSTKDSGSGVLSYEVKEGNGQFVKVESPYRIHNQELNKDITVRAIDKAGNDTIVKVKAENGRDNHMYALIISIVVLLFVVVSVYKRKRFYENTEDSSTNSNNDFS